MNRLGMVVAAVLLLAACGSGGHTASSSLVDAATTAPTTVASTTTVAPSTTTTAARSTTTQRATTTAPHASAPSHVDLTDSDDGHTVSVARGGSVTVVLHSTYWQIKAPSNPSVLQEQGSPVVAPTMQGCVPGGGCGTVTAQFKAVGG